eukprot:CAMPEP_0170529554 /NCGR_PEP_ID=MMETSP0209-20121228/24924_1 /TAXON_ID=665100 ORGANISM="Litonotus pictus, Strain P1" /NCGR_SAMPLE_ID=MMETSP0209 /ASSEMBLY_ACC=CAM_ASM_000301 /LENGTH=128 /DNA_ID=CAMNT_0010821655 /DNA_START=754 /DNA_END=1140 /DNA_ORIENTATION=+
MVSYAVESNFDEFGLEATTEGFNDIEEEGMYKHNIYKSLRKDSLDNRFEQNLRNYPDYFKIYNENYKRYDEINKNEENIAPGEMRDLFEVTKLRPDRAGAMRAWVNKWDPDYNITFKGTGGKTESKNF